MREAVERVVADLEERREQCAEFGVYSRASAFEYAIDQLKAVLANETSDPNRTDGHGPNHSRHD